jgi:hypothetical protein
MATKQKTCERRAGTAGQKAAVPVIDRHDQRENGFFLFSEPRRTS